MGKKDKKTKKEKGKDGLKQQLQFQDTERRILHYAAGVCIVVALIALIPNPQPNEGPRSAYTVYPEDTVLNNFLDWMTSEGGNMNLTVSPVTYKTKTGGKITLRGTTASSSLKSGDYISNTPRAMIMSTKDGLKFLNDLPDPSSPLPRKPARVTPWSALLLLLCVERARLTHNVQPRSHYAPLVDLYQNVELTTTAYWKPEQVQQGTPFLQGLHRAQMAVFEKTYKEYLPYAEFYLAQFPDHFPGTIADYDYNSYMWAWQISTTRHFQVALEDDVPVIFLGPLVDMPNYGRHGCTIKYNHTHNELLFTAHQPFKKGQEVQFFYGEHCSEELLVHYGFDTYDSSPCTHAPQTSVWGFQPKPNEVNMVLEA